jgi:hypothetical protein
VQIVRLMRGVSKVAPRTTTSILLLSVLLVGIVSPTDICALMFARDRGTEGQHHCNHPSDRMPGMIHDHSTVNHADIDAVTPVLLSQSCPSICGRAECLSLSRRVVPQVTVAQTGVVLLNTKAKFLVPDTASTWSSGLGHAPPTASTASFTILRI